MLTLLHDQDVLEIVGQSLVGQLPRDLTQLVKSYSADEQYEHFLSMLIRETLIFKRFSCWKQDEFWTISAQRAVDGTVVFQFESELQFDPYFEARDWCVSDYGDASILWQLISGENALPSTEMVDSVRQELDTCVVVEAFREKLTRRFVDYRQRRVCMEMAAFKGRLRAIK